MAVVLRLMLVAGVGRALTEASVQTQLDYLGTPAVRRPRTSLDALKGVVNAVVLSVGAPADAQAVQTFLNGGAARAAPAAPEASASGSDAAAIASQRTRRDAPSPGTGPSPGRVEQAVVNYSKSVAAAVSANATVPSDKPSIGSANSPANNKTGPVMAATAQAVEAVTEREAEQVHATGPQHLPDGRRMTHEEARQVKQNASGRQAEPSTMAAVAAPKKRRAKRRADEEITPTFKDAPFVTRRGGALGAAAAHEAKKTSKKAADEHPRIEKNNKKNDAELLPTALQSERAGVGSSKGGNTRSHNQHKADGNKLKGVASGVKKPAKETEAEQKSAGRSREQGWPSAVQTQTTEAKVLEKGSRKRRRAAAGLNSDAVRVTTKYAKKQRQRATRSAGDASRRGLTPSLTALASAVVVSPEVLKSVGADVFKVHHHRHKAASKAASKAAPSGSAARSGPGAAARTRRAVRELKQHELPSRKEPSASSPARPGSKGAQHHPGSVGGSVLSVKSNPGVQTEVRTLKDGSQVVVKTGQGPPQSTATAPTSTAAPKKREAERVEVQQAAARPQDEIETLKPKPQHILVKSPGGATHKYDIPHIPQGVTVRGTATFVKALKVIDREAKVRRAEPVDAVDGRLLPISKDDASQEATKSDAQQKQQPARRTRRAAPTAATSPSANQQDEGSVKIYGTLEGEMVKVKGYIKGDLTGAASAYVVPTLLSRYGDMVQGARSGEFLSDQGLRGGQRGEVGFYGSAAQRALGGLTQRAQQAQQQQGQQGQRRDNGYYGNQQGVKSGHDIGRNFDTGQAFDKKGASGTYEDKNGNHRKGFKNAGFRNTYHKDESANSTSFFDDLNDEGGHKAFDQTGSSYLDQGANKNRGDFLNAAFVHDGAGKQGGFDGGSAYEDVRAQAGGAAHHDGFNDRAQLDYQHHGNNHGGTHTQGGKYYNGGGAFNQAEVAATGDRHGGGGGPHGSGVLIEPTVPLIFVPCNLDSTYETKNLMRTRHFSWGRTLTGSLFCKGRGSSDFQNIGSGGFQGGSGGFQGGSGGFQGGSGGFQGGSGGFQGGSSGFQGSSGGFQSGSGGFQGGSGGFQAGPGPGLLGGRDRGGFQSSVITSSGLYDPSSGVRSSNPYPYYPPPTAIPLGYRSQFLPESGTPLMFAPSSNKAITSTPRAYHRFSKSSFRIGGEQDTGPGAGPGAVRGKGLATWETFGNSAQATSLRYALLATPELSRA
ncbi:Isopentenyl-diphosphate delta-isomerase [Frankliniella fusca]|uniref:Isopentenyl-diphosphate delta-isomerase n=1 Tax=Frankliniella fusca TaxID=407009 RepID=A0AAE1HY14_9NEOP|nr:Isopentenyl-diphosphate delta-isomerase [Frankliniella fusca]